MDTEEILETIKAEFRTPDLMTYWPELLRRYKEMGFTDPLTDAQRIDEFIYIVEQIRKFVFTKEKTILSYSHDLNKMLDVVDDLIAKSKEKSPERKTLVYYAIRDEWLLHLRNTISIGIEYQKELNDEW